MLSAEDIVDIFEKLGIDNISIKGDEVSFSCPFPEHKNGDKNPSSSMNVNNSVWHCFGCHRSGNIYSLIAQLQGISAVKAMTWIENAYGGLKRDYGDVSALSIVLNATKQKALSIDKNPPIEPKDGVFILVDWERVASKYPVVVPSLSYLIDRGFTYETLSEFRVCIDRITGRICIPFYNIDKDLVGLKARSVSDEQLPKYLNLGDSEYSESYGFRTPKVSLEVFNIHRQIDTISKYVVIVEGELDAMKLHQYGFSAVSIFGSNMSDTQLNLITSMFDEFVLFFDDDPAGRACTEKFVDTMYKSSVVRVVSSDKDPAELSYDEAHSLIINAKHITKNKILRKLNG